MRTYYIVERRTKHNRPTWTAHNRGILSTIGVFNIYNEAESYSSETSADECEKKLRKYLDSKKFKARVVRVVRIG